VCCFFHNKLCAGAETGWDFSTRWILPSIVSDDDGKSDRFFELANITTTSIVPIDLNSIIYRAQLSIAWLYELSYRNQLLVTQEGSGGGGGGDKLYPDTLVSDWLDIDERCLLDLNSNVGSISNSKSSCLSSKYTFLIVYSPEAQLHLEEAQSLRTIIQEFLWLPEEGRWADGLLSWNSTYMFRDDDNNSANHHHHHKDGGGDDDSVAAESDDVVIRRSSGDVCSAISKGSIHDVRSISGWSAPLWAGLGVMLSDDEVNILMANLLSGADVSDDDEEEEDGPSGLIQMGGVRTTVMGLSEGSQQWDSPNAWAPLQMMLIIGLEQM
jgi:hypothetical protein